MEAESSHLIPVDIVQIGRQEDAAIVFLKGEAPKIIPILVGMTEGQTLLAMIQKIRLGRPTVYELIGGLIGKMNSIVHHLVIHSLRENTFYSYLLIETLNTPIMLDCRPSDGMILAKYFDAPIYVTPELMEEAGQDIPPDEGL